MKKVLILFIAMFALSGTAVADEALATSKGCMACHDKAVKKVGPSYGEVAAKYKDNANAQAELVAKVKAGGSGAWGQIPMPPNAHIPAEDIEKIVAWLLAL